MTVPTAEKCRAPFSSFVTEILKLRDSSQLVTAHLKSGKRGAYLRANLDRAKLHKLRQFRYVRFLKTDWIKRLRMPILPYPKRQPD